LLPRERVDNGISMKDKVLGVWKRMPKFGMDVWLRYETTDANVSLSWSSIVYVRTEEIVWRWW
jgi:hypothetical protein